ncbi:mCG14587, isoform CRA_d [Mus musculus]|nr:mCG14587, isoform CRA_d [Mus musculus]
MLPARLLRNLVSMSELIPPRGSFDQHLLMAFILNRSWFLKSQILRLLHSLIDAPDTMPAA